LGYYWTLLEIIVYYNKRYEVMHYTKALISITKQGCYRLGKVKEIEINHEKLRKVGK